MKSMTAVLALVIGWSFSAEAACPADAPRAAMGISAPCFANTACPNGPVTFTIYPSSSGGFPPAAFDPGYTVQACDDVTWDFGDGSTQTVAGLDRVTHDYPAPANYTITATVANALGSASVSASYVIASAPSKVSFATEPCCP